MDTKPFLALASVCLLFTACASTGASSDVSPLVGKYQSGEVIAIFNADGTYEGTTPQNDTWVRGTYRIDGDQVTLQDTWESDSLFKQMGKSCMGIAGRYSWVIEDDKLTAIALDDACEGRKRGTSGVEWTRMR